MPKLRLEPAALFRFSWYFDECDEAMAANNTLKLILEDEVDVILGPPCTQCMTNHPHTNIGRG